MMRNYLNLVKQHVKDDYAVIIIDNPDIAKPSGRKFEALSEIRNGFTEEITQGYLTIEAAVLSETGKMPLSVVYGFGKDPMLLLPNLNMQEKNRAISRRTERKLQTNL